MFYWLHSEEWKNESTVVPFKGHPDVVPSELPSGATGAKKRKVSSAGDSNKEKVKATGNDQQRENKQEAHANADTGKKYILKKSVLLDLWVS